MYISNSEIRARARTALDRNPFSRKWIILILMSVVTSIIFGAANYLCCGLGTLLLCGPLYVGLYKAHLKVAQGYSDIKFDTVFEGCNNFGSNLVLGLMHTLIVTLWSLLFIIPGIIKSYSYALVYYIKAEHPEYGWRECLDESEKMMRGYKFKLFMLHLSFVGWLFLSTFTCGIGTVWVNTYLQTATAVFYQELKTQKMYI